MPEEMFKKDFGSLSKNLEIDDKISKMAEMYHVSFSAATVRLSSLRLI